jgi:hypothetical protein
MSGSQTPHLVEEESELQNTQEAWKEQKYGYVTKMAMLARGSSSLLNLMSVASQSPCCENFKSKNYSCTALGSDPHLLARGQHLNGLSCIT